jgi:hypothetical protein
MMLSKRIRRFLLVCSSFLILSATAVSASEPTPQPTPFQTPTPPEVSPGVNPEESIPVVISYGQNQETRVQVYRGLMDPVGVPADKGVIVTVLLPAAYAGQIVRLGLYDGGQVSVVVSPDQDTTTISVGELLAAANGSVLFNFKAGATLGLYRVLMTVGPAQFLLQFYAVRPRSTSDLPSPDLSPPPPPSTPPPE